MKHVFVFFLYSFLMCATAMAQDTYVIRNIAVDAEGSNAIDAKNKALNLARRNGFNALIKRLGVDKESFSADDRSISTMVNSFEINREKSSRNRYLASVNVMFNENAVQAYLGRNTNIAIDDGMLNNHNFGTSSSNLYGRELAEKQIGRNRSLSSYKTEVVINGLSHLVSLKKSMSRIPALGGVLLSSIKSNRAVLEIKYDGDAEGLKMELMRRGLQLLPNQMGMASGVPYTLVARR